MATAYLTLKGLLFLIARYLVVLNKLFKSRFQIQIKNCLFREEELMG